MGLNSKNSPSIPETSHPIYSYKRRRINPGNNECQRKSTPLIYARAYISPTAKNCESITSTLSIIKTTQELNEQSKTCLTPSIGFNSRYLHPSRSSSNNIQKSLFSDLLFSKCKDSQIPPKYSIRDEQCSSLFDLFPFDILLNLIEFLTGTLSIDSSLDEYTLAAQRKNGLGSNKFVNFSNLAFKLTPESLISELLLCFSYHSTLFPFSIRLFSGPLTIRAIQRHSLPDERLDLWNSPTAPPQFLPQSVLHGRCGAILHLVHGTTEENSSVIQKSNIRKCMNCGFSSNSFSIQNPRSSFTSAFNDPESIDMVEYGEVESFQRNRRKQQRQLLRTAVSSPIQFGEIANCPYPGRLLCCGGYGMFELWDHNVTMRCNEVSVI